MSHQNPNTTGHYMARAVKPAFSFTALALMSACTFTVDSTLDRVDANVGDRICADNLGRCTLRAAIMEVNAINGPYRIAVPAGTYPLTLTGRNGSYLEVKRNVRIQGAGKLQTIVDAQTAYPVMHVTGGSDVQIQSLTLTRGNSSGGGGLRVENNANVTLTHVRLDDNFATTGGGGLSVDEKASVTGNYVEFTNNRSTGAFGGAVWNLGFLRLNESLMAGNESNRAGALHNNPTGILNLYNVTVSGNLGISNTRSVGGIMQTGFAVLRNVTVTENEGGADVGAGGIQTLDGQLTVAKNSIFANNARRINGVPEPHDCLGALTSDSRYNLIETLEGCTLPAATSTYILGVDAELATLSSNSGSTRTHRLLDSSPAIDAGYPYPPGTLAADACRAYDQRGVPRPQTLYTETQEGICDLGAYEAGNSPARISRFVLVNADTDTDIGPLRHGDVVNMNELPPNLSIRAEVEAAFAAESVNFGYDDNPSVRIENTPPYAIAGDASGDYAPFDFGETAEHTMRATPFSGDDATGSAGVSMDISFIVIAE